MRAVISPSSYSDWRRSRRDQPPATLTALRLKRSFCVAVFAASVRIRGSPVPHCWQRRTSLFGVPGIRAGSNQKSPSVVALSRVARGERASPVSPPAAGRGSKEVVFSSLGGCPASCPDAHRPTHGHRHVRNWANPHLCATRAQCKKKFRRRRLTLDIFHRERREN